MWSTSLLSAVLIFTSHPSLGHGAVGLSTQGLSLCPSQQFMQDPSATVNPQDLQSVIVVDNTSVALVGENSNLQLDVGAKVELNVQSGFRVLARSTVSLSANARITAIESSHVSITRRMKLGPNVVITLSSGRIFDSETLNLQDSSRLTLQDGSHLSVFEGGSITFGSGSKVELYKGSTMAASEWWVYVGPDGEPKSVVNLGPANQITLVDLSNVHVAGDGRLTTGSGVTIELQPQSALVVVGRLNITDQSRLKIGTRAQLVVGLPKTDNDVTDRLARGDSSSLIFAQPSLILILGQGVTFRVNPDAHCLVIVSADVTDDVQFNADSNDKSFVRCFSTYDKLIVYLAKSTGD